jgi:hypothetical protein
VNPPGAAIVNLSKSRRRFRLQHPVVTLRNRDLIMSLGNPQDEYMDLSTSIRHWGNMRFAQLTVLIALSAGMFAAVYHQDFASSGLPKLLVKIGGCGVVLIFWTMDERVVKYWCSARDRAVVLEGTLGYGQYVTAPPRGLFCSRNAVRLLFLMLLAFWIISFFA